MQIYGLDGDRYVESTQSLAFPFLLAGRILQFIDESNALGLMTFDQELDCSSLQVLNTVS